MINWQKLAQERGFNNDREMFVTYSKQKKTLTQIAKEFGVSYFAIYKRLRKLGFKKGDLFPPGNPNIRIRRKKRQEKIERTDRVCRKCGKPCWPNYFYCNDCLRLISKVSNL